MLTDVVQVYGVCFTRPPWLLVTEFMKYRDLGFVLKESKKLGVALRIHELMVLALEIADGLRYLDEVCCDGISLLDWLNAMEQKRIIHRDIAVRNVLLGENNVVKIADFGQARFLQEGENDWKLDKIMRMPIRYMSPESLSTKRFSLKSDVWAFGVAIWEILTFADSFVLRFPS